MMVLNAQQEAKAMRRVFAAIDLSTAKTTLLCSFYNRKSPHIVHAKKERTHLFPLQKII